MFEYIEDDESIEDFGSEVTSTSYVDIGYTERYGWYTQRPKVKVLKEKVNYFSANFFAGVAVTLIVVAALTLISHRENSQ